MDPHQHRTLYGIGGGRPYIEGQAVFRLRALEIAHDVGEPRASLRRGRAVLGRIADALPRRPRLGRREPQAHNPSPRAGHPPHNPPPALLPSPPAPRLYT